MLPSSNVELNQHVDGRVAFRCVTSDRMPMIGQFADETAAQADASRLSRAWPLDLPRAAGLYGAFAFGSRGLVWSALGAELIASQIEGEPGRSSANSPKRWTRALSLSRISSRRIQISALCYPLTPVDNAAKNKRKTRALAVHVNGTTSRRAAPSKKLFRLAVNRSHDHGALLPSASC